MSLLYGLEKYAKPFRDVLLLPVIDYTKRDAELSAKLELKAEDLGMLTGRADAMIVSIVMNRGASPYKFDLKHFKVFKNLGLKLFPF